MPKIKPPAIRDNLSRRELDEMFYELMGKDDDMAHRQVNSEPGFPSVVRQAEDSRIDDYSPRKNTRLHVAVHA